MFYVNGKPAEICDVLLTLTGTGLLFVERDLSTALTYLLQTLSQRYMDETKAAMILSMVLIPEIKWKRRLIGNGVGKGENGDKK